MVNYLINFLLISGKYLTKAASHTLLKILCKSGDVRNHLAFEYDKAICMVGTQENMFEAIHNRLEEIGFEGEIHIAVLNDRIKCELEEYLNNIERPLSTDGERGTKFIIAEIKSSRKDGPAVSMKPIDPSEDLQRKTESSDEVFEIQTKGFVASVMKPSRKIISRAKSEPLHPISSKRRSKTGEDLREDYSVENIVNIMQESLKNQQKIVSKIEKMLPIIEKALPQASRAFTDDLEAGPVIVELQGFSGQRAIDERLDIQKENFSETVLQDLLNEEIVGPSSCDKTTQADCEGSNTGCANVSTSTNSLNDRKSLDRISAKRNENKKKDACVQRKISGVDKNIQSRPYDARSLPTLMAKKNFFNSPSLHFGNDLNMHIFGMNNKIISNLYYNNAHMSLPCVTSLANLHALRSTLNCTIHRHLKSENTGDEMTDAKKSAKVQPAENKPETTKTEGHKGRSGRPVVEFEEVLEIGEKFVNFTPNKKNLNTIEAKLDIIKELFGDEEIQPKSVDKKPEKIDPKSLSGLSKISQQIRKKKHSKRRDFANVLYVNKKCTEKTPTSKTEKLPCFDKGNFERCEKILNSKKDQIQEDVQKTANLMKVNEKAFNTLEKHVTQKLLAEDVPKIVKNSANNEKRVDRAEIKNQTDFLRVSEMAFEDLESNVLTVKILDKVKDHGDKKFDKIANDRTSHLPLKRKKADEIKPKTPKSKLVTKSHQMESVSLNKTATRPSAIPVAIEDVTNAMFGRIPPVERRSDRFARKTKAYMERKFLAPNRASKIDFVTTPYLNEENKAVPLTHQQLLLKDALSKELISRPVQEPKLKEAKSVPKSENFCIMHANENLNVEISEDLHNFLKNVGMGSKIQKPQPPNKSGKKQQKKEMSDEKKQSPKKDVNLEGETVALTHQQLLLKDALKIGQPTENKASVPSKSKNLCILDASDNLNMEISNDLQAFLQNVGMNSEVQNEKEKSPNNLENLNVQSKTVALTFQKVLLENALSKEGKNSPQEKNVKDCLLNVSKNVKMEALPETNLNSTVPGEKAITKILPPTNLKLKISNASATVESVKNSTQRENTIVEEVVKYLRETKIPKINANLPMVKTREANKPKELTKTDQTNLEKDSIKAGDKLAEEKQIVTINQKNLAKDSIKAGDKLAEEKQIVTINQTNLAKDLIKAGDKLAEEKQIVTINQTNLTKDSIKTGDKLAEEKQIVTINQTNLTKDLIKAGDKLAEEKQIVTINQTNLTKDGDKLAEKKQILTRQDVIEAKQSLLENLSKTIAYQLNFDSTLQTPKDETKMEVISKILPTEKSAKSSKHTFQVSKVESKDGKKSDDLKNNVLEQLPAANENSKIAFSDNLVTFLKDQQKLQEPEQAPIIVEEVSDRKEQNLQPVQKDDKVQESVVAAEEMLLVRKLKVAELEVRKPGKNIYNNRPFSFKREFMATALPPHSTTFWNMEPRAPVVVMNLKPPEPTRPKKYKYATKEIKSFTGGKVKITYLVTDDSVDKQVS